MPAPPRPSPRALLVLLPCLLGALLLPGCDKVGTAPGPTPAPGPIPVADPAPVPIQETRTVQVEIDLDTLDVKPVGPEGVRSCNLCTKTLEAKYGPKCEGAPKAGLNLCAGLIDATVDDMRQIGVLASHKNPYCVTIASTIVGGTVRATQLCYCLPTDPAGSCPAPMWVQ
jgi:hypothetical protein